MLFALYFLFVLCIGIFFFGYAGYERSEIHPVCFLMVYFAMNEISMQNEVYSSLTNSPDQSSTVTTCANSLTSFTVSTLTVTTFPTRCTIYSSLSNRLGSLSIPLLLSLLTWY